MASDDDLPEYYQSLTNGIARIAGIPILDDVYEDLLGVGIQINKNKIETWYDERGIRAAIDLDDYDGMRRGIGFEEVLDTLVEMGYERGWSSGWYGHFYKYDLPPTNSRVYSIYKSTEIDREDFVQFEDDVKKLASRLEIDLSCKTIGMMARIFAFSGYTIKLRSDSNQDMRILRVATGSGYGDSVLSSTVERDGVVTAIVHWHNMEYLCNRLNEAESYEHTGFYGELIRSIGLSLHLPDTR